MKLNFYKFFLFIVCTAFAQFLFGQAPGVPKWSTSGNTLGTGSNKLGSLDAKAVKIVTNNTTRIYIDSITGNVGINTLTPTDKFYVKGNQVLAGNLTFTASNQSIQFALPAAGSTPMMYMFPSGTGNLPRMVIGHSPGFPTYGIEYTDATDQWDFMYAGTPAVSINYNNLIARNNFSAKELYISDTGTVAKRLGVGGNPLSNYVLNVNASSALHAIYVNDPVDNYILYSSKTGQNEGIFIYKSSTNSSTPVIRGHSTGSGDGVWGISNSGSGVWGKSTNNVGVLGQTDNPGSWAGYFTGSVYTTGTYQSSDARLKKNIKTVDNAMNIINQLQPKNYEFRNDGDYAKLQLPKGNHFGLLAQDVEKILPNLVKEATINTRYFGDDLKEGNKGKDIEFKAVNYTELIPVMIKGMQEQQSTIEKQNQTISNLQKQIDDLKNLIQSKGIASSNEISTTSQNSLQQNAPNPFNSTTTIRYNVTSNASLQILSKDGNVIKTYSIAKGSGQVTVNASELSAGTYTYKLFVNGKIVDSKQMVLTK